MRLVWALFWRRVQPQLFRHAVARYGESIQDLYETDRGPRALSKCVLSQPGKCSEIYRPNSAVHLHAVGAGFEGRRPSRKVADLFRSHKSAAEYLPQVFH